MTAFHFNQSMTRLEGAFDRNYADTQKKIIFEKTQKWTDETFSMVVNHLIEAYSHKPPISAFFKAITGLRESGKFKREDSETSDCVRCGGAGVVRVYYEYEDTWHEITNRSGVARCNCANAQRWSILIKAVGSLAGVYKEQRVSSQPQIIKKQAEPVEDEYETQSVPF